MRPSHCTVTKGNRTSQRANLLSKKTSTLIFKRIDENRKASNLAIHFSNQKKKKKMDEDRISELGDAILLHILCSINIKQAVQTSILSKRWQNLWTSISHLNFNFKSMAILSGLHTDGNPFDSEIFMPSFTNFVTQFLSNRDHTSSIRKFQLSGSQLVGTDPTSVSEWVDYATNRGVQHLDLDFLMNYPLLFKLPAAFCGCQTLRELRLRRPGYGFVVPKPLILPNLKSLYLESFTFKDDDSIYYFPKEPFSGFPNLEKLSLHHCEVSSLVIFSSKLRILEFYFTERLRWEKAKMKQISTPMLTSLRYMYMIYPSYIKSGHYHLVHFYVTLCATCTYLVLICKFFFF